jgi:hypothetical protein
MKKNHYNEKSFIFNIFLTVKKLNNENLKENGYKLSYNLRFTTLYY